MGIWSPPTVLSWPAMYKANSLYNTLELLPVYIASLVIQDLLTRHGPSKLRGQAALVQTKSDALYNVLDKHSNVYKVVPNKQARSRMNICFRIINSAAESSEANADAEKEFIKGSEQRKLTGLKGHRSVGGIRISNYNAVTESQINLLVSWLEDFAKSTH